MVPGENNMLVPTQSTSVADDPKALCIIRDMTSSTAPPKVTLNLPATYTCQELIEEVAKQFEYEPNSFNLEYEKPNYESGVSEEISVMEFMSKTLGEFCVNIGSNKRNTFNLMDKDGVQPIKSQPMVKSESNGDSNYGVSASTSTYSSNPYSYNPSYSSYSYASALIKSDTGYVGLVNQAMTCYLNSLLQTLYMTPEFRNAVYRWEFDGSPEESAKSIPYQLQRLFLLLQTSKKRAAETTDITKSFGWDSSEAWQQHDVQELCRVMFDALEKKWKKTDQSNLINQLYQGKMKDYVKCLECGYESARLDAYLDIPLVIRPFGANTAYGSVEEALEAFVKPETLEGNNQYFCEKCNKKCNAHKGLKFQKFPYLLTLQLMRFDFDYTTMHRIKLNERMTFPEILNLNAHVDDGDDGGGEPDSEAGDPGGLPKDSPSGASAPPSQNDEGPDQGIDIGYTASGTSAHEDSANVSSSEAAANDRNARDSQKKGPYEYELFSIMIHSGSAAGGHYYAYIKSFKDGRWYSFNDQHVSTITYDDIKKTYGGSTTSRGYYSATYASSTNAYMLMYRQIDKERNKDFMNEGEFPPHLKKQLDLLTETEEAEKRQRELDRCTCKIRIFCFHPIASEDGKSRERRLEVHKEKSLTEATEAAWKLFDLEDKVRLEDVRIVKYDENQDNPERSYEGEEETTIGAILGGVKSIYTYELLLETKLPEQEFQEYKPGGVTVKIHMVDITDELNDPPECTGSIRAYLTQTIGEFKTNLAAMINSPVEKMRCVREGYYNDLKLLCVPGKTLKIEGFIKSKKVFVECSGQEDDSQVSFPETRFYRQLDRYQNTIHIHIHLPPCAKDCAKSSPTQSSSLPSTTGKANHTKSSPDATTISVKPSSVSSKGSDVDEGICDVEEEQSGTDLYSSTSADEQGSGPLRSSLLASGDHAGLHSAISETIHKQNLQSSFEKNVAGGGNNRSDSTTTSPNTSPRLSPTTSRVTRDVTRGGADGWDLDDAADDAVKEDEYRRYFRARLSVDAITGDRTLTARVDKRTTMASLKKELEPYVGTTSDYFKVYRVYSNQDCEVTRLSDTMTTYSDNSKLNVKLGRALRKGEYRVKVYELNVKETEPCKFLLDAIFAKQMTVLESKKIILQELKAQSDIDVPLDRCRLRKKSWKNPGTIYSDEQKYDDNIPIMTNWEVFLEVLEGPEMVVETSQLQMYIRRWWPSKYQVGPFQEIVLDTNEVQELKDKISESSGIPAARVEFAKARGTFPCETSLLEMHNDIEWNPQVTSINIWPVSITDDGAIIYYRDKEEDLMDLSEEKKKVIQQKENVRLSKYNTRVTYSPRKERALKIYTDDSPEVQSSNAIPLPPTALAPDSVSSQVD